MSRRLLAKAFPGGNGTIIDAAGPDRASVTGNHRMAQPLIGGAGRINIVSSPQQLLCSSAGTAFFIRASGLAGARLRARAGLSI